MSLKLFLLPMVLLSIRYISLPAKPLVPSNAFNLELQAMEAAQAGCFQEAYHLLQQHLFIEREQHSTLMAKFQENCDATTPQVYASAIYGLLSVVLLFLRKKDSAVHASSTFPTAGPPQPDIPQNLRSASTFLEQAEKAILEHMEEDAFGVTALSEVLHVSRSQLHRRIKAKCNYSPSVFMRKVRLREAKRLLEAKAGNISEVAIIVGMPNLAYFSRSFKAEYGYPPSQLLQS